MKTAASPGLSFQAAIFGLLLAGFQAIAGEPSQSVRPEPGTFEISTKGNGLRISANNVEPYRIAEAIVKETGLTFADIELLRKAGPVGINYPRIPAQDVLAMLASETGRMMRCKSGHCRLDAAGSARRFDSLLGAWRTSQEDGDESAELAARKALLDYVRPDSDGLISQGSDVWWEVAEFDRKHNDLDSETALLTEYLSFLPAGAPMADTCYTAAMFRLGQIRKQAGDVDAAQKLFSQALAFATQVDDPSHTRLARARLEYATVQAEDFRSRNAAAALYREVIATFPDPKADDDASEVLLQALHGSAIIELRLHHWAEVIPVAEHAIRLRKQIGIVVDDEFRKSDAEAHALGIALLSREDRLDEAKQWLEQASNGSPLYHSLPAAWSLDALQALGEFAGEPGAAHDLGELETRFSKVMGSLGNLSLAAMLEARAHYQYRESPESSGWQTSCAASAIVATTWLQVSGDRLKQPREANRKARESSCLESVKAGKAV